MLDSCPLCQAPWIRRDHGWIHGAVEREDINDQFCPLQGSHLFDDQFSRLEEMLPKQPMIHYEVVDGYPVFNEFGQGTPADAATVTAFINYFKEKISAG